MTPEALTAERLAHYDALVIYANHETLTPEQEQALVDFVEGGKGAGRDPLRVGHVHRVRRYIPLIGGQFLRHGTGSSRPRSSDPTTRR